MAGWVALFFLTVAAISCMIWVLKKCRRAGPARRLVTEVCRSLQVSLEEVAHVTPFTDDALQFWQSFSLHNLFVV